MNYWMDASNPAPKLNNDSASSASARTPARTSTLPPAPAPAPQLDKGKGRKVTPLRGSSVSAPRVDKGKAREVTPGNPFSPSSNAGRQSLEEEILSPATAAAAQRRCDLLASAGSARGDSGSYVDPLSGLLGMGGMGDRTLGGGNNNDPLSSLLGSMGGLGGRTLTTRSSSPPPTGLAGRPLGSPIQQTAHASPPSGHAAGGHQSGVSGMAGLEGLLSGLGGLGPGGGLGGLGRMGRGGFDPGMFGPEFFGPGSDKDKADSGDRGTTGTKDDTPKSGTWSGMGIQSKLNEDHDDDS